MDPSIQSVGAWLYNVRQGVVYDNISFYMTLLTAYQNCDRGVKDVIL